MTIELPLEIEGQLVEAARVQGVSVGQYVERLVQETGRRDREISGFRAAIAERMASLDLGLAVDGEEVMARLIGESRPA